MSWLIQAIERAAMDRAREQMAATGMDRLQVAGLTLQQILWLRADYIKRTGESPDTIPGGEPQ